MTTPDTDTADTPPEEPRVLAGLRAVRASRAGGRRPVRKATTPRKATASRADSAAKRGKYVDRIVGAIKTGCALLSVRAPIQAGILMERAEPIAEALQRVADEDKRVDAFIAKVSGFFGKSTAWGELGGQIGVTGAAMALSAGAVPTGPVGLAIAFIGGELLDAGLHRASLDAATAHLKRLGYDPAAPAQADMLRGVAQEYYEHYKASIPAPGQAPAPADDLEHPPATDDADATQVINGAVPEPAWA